MGSVESRRYAQPLVAAATCSLTIAGLFTLIYSDKWRARFGELHPINKAVIALGVPTAGFLLHRAFEPNLVEKDSTEIDNAIVTGDVEAVRKLLDSGVKPGAHLLDLAAAQGHTDVVRLLLERGCDPNEAREDGRTPLHAAALGGHQEIATLLLDNGATVDPEGYCMSPFCMATVEGHFELANLLVGRGANVNWIVDPSTGKTLLHTTICVNQESNDKGSKVREYLLRTQIDVEPTMKGGITPLQLACMFGDLEAVRNLIIEAGASATGTSGGPTPLYLAAEAGNLEIAQLLVEKKARVDAVVDVEGYRLTPWCIAAINGHTKVANYLLTEEANLGHVIDPASGETLLHLSVHKGMRPLRLHLLLLQLNRDPRMQGGLTPLHRACELGNFEAVQDLISAKADLEAETESGDTAYTIAKRLGHTEIRNEIKEAKRKGDSYRTVNRRPVHRRSSKERPRADQIADELAAAAKRKQQK